ncbi:DUF5318 family protein [Corynebacterium ulceribovis]|uniref:DUF5318 family protein n=1 Tax=Corynebacterium ulceribovis TaxID=487732 RepID=UPI0009FD5D49|nr:DUF5318 family protein [Corynebacterium ulceribovis]
MFVKKDELDRSLLRTTVLRQWRAGEEVTPAVIPADRQLINSARDLGVPSEKPCPVCGRDSLRLVLWVYGEHLGQISGTARALVEVEQLVANFGEVTVHEVEVCTSCRWNFLLRAATAIAG